MTHQQIIKTMVAKKLKILKNDLIIDDNTLDFWIDEKINYCKNFCNIDDINTAMYNIVVDLVCGSVLNTAISNNIITDDFNVKSTRIGDTAVEFKDGSYSLINTINELLNQDSNLLKFRCIAW